MDDAERAARLAGRGVRMVERVERILEHRDHMLDRDRDLSFAALFLDAPQVAAKNKLHRQKPTAGNVADFQHLDDVLMTETRRDAGLVHEEFGLFLVVDKIFTNCLDNQRLFISAPPVKLSKEDVG